MNISPLKLGGKEYPNYLIQGPLAGVSCAPFRRLTWRYSQPAFVYTEMMSCKTLLHASAKQVTRFTSIAEDEGPVCFQLAGSDAKELGEAVKKVTDLGASLIDLNCGCPVKKIRSKGAGSRLLTDTANLYRLISAMKANTHLPVLVKIRVEGNSGERFHQELVHVLTEGGADAVVVHGRHWTEHYETPCKHGDIDYFVNELPIPVIGNGDVSCKESLMKMHATGCAGVMISRAGVGQPWLIHNLLAEKPYLPSLQEVVALFVEHIRELALLLENEKQAMLQARKLTKYYLRHQPISVAMIAAVNKCDSMKDFIALSRHFSA